MTAANSLAAKERRGERTLHSVALIMQLSLVSWGSCKYVLQLNLGGHNNNMMVFLSLCPVCQKSVYNWLSTSYTH